MQTPSPSGEAQAVSWLRTKSLHSYLEVVGESENAQEAIGSVIPQYFSFVYLIKCSTL
ncbi:MAG: hypothetical protein HC769_37920 [Cyanobacteria bacterium CRU_2_1]|nr:hypothetical protein [Cyanobacteria bacterium CRU_2_1]